MPAKNIRTREKRRPGASQEEVDVPVLVHVPRAAHGVAELVAGGRLIIALNFRSERVTLDLAGDVVLSTRLNRNGIADELELGPDEGVIVRV